MVLPMEVKKSLWAESDCRQLSNSKHKHGSSILKNKINRNKVAINYHIYLLFN